MYSFSNLTLCKPDETKKGIKFIHELVNACKSGVVGPREQTLIILVANVLIHLQIDGVPPINGFLSQLPAGLRVLGCYIMAHQAYLKGEYEKGLGIVETSLSQGGDEYTIPTIYLYLSGAMNAMSVDNVELGKENF